MSTFQIDFSAAQRKRIVGIDLGTTNSLVAFMDATGPQVIPGSDGSRLVPSVVSLDAEGGFVVGEAARRLLIDRPDRTVYSVKRLMGRGVEDVREELRLFPFRIAEGSEQVIRLELGGRQFTPPEISAQVLRELKRRAEQYLGQEVTQAVITVPAYFEDQQRQATKDAGKIAGLEVLRIINEPTAAALAYGLDKEHDRTILVYDLGGGTFDVSVLEIGEGVFEVKSTSGNNHLGGDDFDQKVIDWMAEDFKAKNGIDLREDKMALQRLKEAAEKAKIELSSTLSASINLPFITADQNGPKHLEMTLSRAEFQKLTVELVEATRGPVTQAMKDAKVTGADLEHVVMVGGATRMPAVVDLVKSLTGKEPHKGVNPDEVVSVGAAIQGGVLKGEVKDILLLDVTPLSLGIETKGGVFTKLIERNTTIPTKKSEIFTTADDNQTQVEVHVLQGEREMATYNKTLGRFNLVGLPPAPRGVPQVEVAFDIDANGIVNVSAKDLGTGQEQKITITASTALNEDEIKRMVKEADSHAEEDRKRREEAEIRNNADNLVYGTEKTLKDLGDKVPEEDRVNIEAALTEAKEAIKGEDVEKIKTTSEELAQKSHKLAEIMYQQNQGEQQAEGQASEGESGEPAEGEVIDAEVVDEEEK